MKKEDKKLMDFEDYKKIATEKDIKDFEAIYKPKVWENFPLIGTIAYGWRIRIATSGIDRGPLRKEITKQNMKFTFMFLIYFYIMFTIITPWFTYWYLNIAVKNTKELMKTKNA